MKSTQYSIGQKLLATRIVPNGAGGRCLPKVQVVGISPKGTGYYRDGRVPLGADLYDVRQCLPNGRLSDKVWKVFADELTPVPEGLEAAELLVRSFQAQSQ